MGFQLIPEILIFVGVRKEQVNHNVDSINGTREGEESLVEQSGLPDTSSAAPRLGHAEALNPLPSSTPAKSILIQLVCLDSKSNSIRSV